MSWVDLVDNPMQVTQLYSSVPDLNKITLTEVELGDRLDFSLKFIFSRLPDRIPDRWKYREYTTVQFELDFWGIKDFTLTDYHCGELWTFHFSKNEDGWIRFEGKSDTGRIAGSCRALYLQHVTLL
ncbi:MAG: Imm50 family immunity protein [Thermoactinomyces sp.]